MSEGGKQFQTLDQRFDKKSFWEIQLVSHPRSLLQQRRAPPHVDTRQLRFERGKKFRPESDMDTVFAELRHWLDCYVTCSARGDEERLEELERWADTVYKRCKVKWESFSHLRGPILACAVTFRKLKKSLVFLLDDRAPPALQFCANVGTKRKWPSIFRIIPCSKILS